MHKTLKIGSRGRTEVITPAQVLDIVCAGLAEGRSLSELCRLPGMPDRRTLTDWAAADDVDRGGTGAIRSRLARSRELGEEAIIDQLIPIADDLTDDPASRKVRIYARTQYLAVSNPAKYGTNRGVNGNGGIVINASKEVAFQFVAVGSVADLTAMPSAPPFDTGGGVHRYSPISNFSPPISTNSTSPDSGVPDFIEGELADPSPAAAS